MIPNTPYSHHLDGRDPVVAMRDSVKRFERLLSWTPAQMERVYAPGKWTARQVLAHLAQAEIALGGRARYALSTPNYASQNFDQDAWFPFDAALPAHDALRMLIAAISMNAAMYGGLSEEQRATPFTHPEYGALSVNWILYQQAGHHIHHLKQIEGIRD
jgi:hypothetical protein